MRVTKLLSDVGDQAATLREDLDRHGRKIADAVQSNTYAVALVAVVSVVALVVGVTALAKARR